MSTTVAKYTFSSWLRKGIGANINEIDNLGTGSSAVKERATVPVDVAINTQNIHKNFALLGPGDIIGINPSMVVRTEPLNWITNFEPNYLAFIEFYDEDFAWRYTPAKANGRKLRPWLALLILKEDEFTRDNKSLPLPSITVKAAASMPPPNDTWTWAHAHINEGYQSQTDFEKFLQTLHDLNSPNADKIICRLMSPRKLDADSAYYAFVVPAFETGRKAGLTEETTDTDSQQPSWSATSNNVKFPVYYEWFFRTGKNEDFEFLVKLLEPRVMDERVGRRDMDGTKPGFGLTVGTDIGEILPVTQPQEVIGLEGALKAPSTKSRPRVIDTTKPFFTQLKDIVNFPAVLQKATNNSNDPVVSPPIYGENHALEHELNIADTGWMHLLNKDPRNRVPAGFGTDVVQKNQDDLMARAWQQVQKVLDANKRILLASFAMNFAETIKNNFTSRLDAGKTLLFFSPLLKKIKGSPTTIQHQMLQSTVPTASVSAAFRRVLRTRGAYFRKLKAADPSFQHSRLITDLNNEKVSAAPPKQVPKGLLTVENLSGQLPASRISPFFKFLVRHRLLILIILVLLLLIFGLITGLWIVAGIIAAAVAGAYLYAAKQQPSIEFSDAVANPERMAELIEQTPPRPGFVFSETDPAVAQPVTAGTQVTSGSETITSSVQVTTTTYHTAGAAGGDSIEARNFRTAAVSLNKRLAVKAPEKRLVKFDLENAHKKISLATDPQFIFPRQLAALVYFSFNPDWLRKPEHLVPAMAYPAFDDPMYEKLRDISSELLLPNLNLIPQNTISLLVTNPPFIESYMVGLNHEFGKELLWREYPTDKRGSYFRQFWDVKGIITSPDPDITPEQLTENFRDITPIDTWEHASVLGEHNKRNLHGGKNVVLVVRGDLLKKYPNTIIYAQKARIYKNPHTNTPDATHEPVIIEVQSEGQMHEEIKFPIFKAEILPDIKFFGFDLTTTKAYGDADPKKETDDWGYYFIIQQIPGEPRFGMDIEYDPDDDATTPITWDDMAWNKYDPTRSFLESAVKPVPGFNPGGSDNRNQWGTDSASMAYILYQKPVMIAIHAKEMLDKLDH